MRTRNMTQGGNNSRRMVRLGLWLCLVVWSMPVGQVSAGSAEVADPRAMTFNPVTFTPPAAERVTFDNGIVVYVLEDHELPLINLSAMMRVGTWLDPLDKTGLAGLTGHLLRDGGSEKMSAQEVDEALEQIAANIAFSIGEESGSATLDVLKKDLRTGLRIFAGLLRAPAFDAERLELAKLQAVEAIRRRQDQPGAIAAREFTKLIYGAAHPYARESTVESVRNITREDVTAFYRRTIHPNGIIFGVTGDFEKGAMIAALREAFGDWVQGEVPKMNWPAVPAEPGSGQKAVLHYVGKETSQAHLRVGHLTLKEHDPDYPALAIVNDILGGAGFRSRLFKDVRTNRGLAYSVGSRLQANVYERGLWSMRAETKLASAQEVVGRFMAQLERIRKESVTDSELTEAKDAFVNAFVFSFANSASIVGRLIDLEYDGLPKDWLQQLRDKVVKLTKEDLQRAAQQHLHPERLRVLAVGSPTGLAKALAAFGEVQEIKLPPEAEG